MVNSRPGVELAREVGPYRRQLDALIASGNEDAIAIKANHKACVRAGKTTIEDYIAVMDRLKKLKREGLI